ncbi:hypothetical protein K431DRAFT_20873 [Polychaeton citri CBS 116435]|uniref:Uncharacterized protein n=1 Tax=Polychaeton citri CBS 116435 TaxID=1314669 RepID=A0A9P4UJE9_9PEZI|nr:hypothetical protein K431DRAFT_20873 [Polychaeton citri CBS 116435]
MRLLLGFLVDDINISPPLALQTSGKCYSEWVIALMHAVEVRLVICHHCSRGKQKAAVLSAIASHTRREAELGNIIETQAALPGCRSRRLRLHGGCKSMSRNAIYPAPTGRPVKTLIPFSVGKYRVLQYRRTNTVSCKGIQSVINPNLPEYTDLAMILMTKTCYTRSTRLCGYDPHALPTRPRQSRSATCLPSRLGM